MLPARYIGVSDDDDCAALKRLRELRSPLPGAHRIAGRDLAERPETVHVLLALDHEERLADALRNLDEIVQAVGNQSCPFDGVDPSTVPIWPTLNKGLLA